MAVANRCSSTSWPVDEPAPLDQVFGRVPAYYLLREQGDRDVLGGQFAGRGDALINVGGECADGGIDIGQSDFDESHWWGCSDLHPGL